MNNDIKNMINTKMDDINFTENINKKVITKCLKVKRARKIKYISVAAVLAVIMLSFIIDFIGRGNEQDGILMQKVAAAPAYDVIPNENEKLIIEHRILNIDASNPDEVVFNAQYVIKNVDNEKQVLRISLPYDLGTLNEKNLKNIYVWLDGKEVLVSNKKGVDGSIISNRAVTAIPEEIKNKGTIEIIEYEIELTTGSHMLEVKYLKSADISYVKNESSFLYSYIFDNSDNIKTNKTAVVWLNLSEDYYLDGCSSEYRNTNNISYRIIVDFEKTTQLDFIIKEKEQDTVYMPEEIWSDYENTTPIELIGFSYESNKDYIVIDFAPDKWLNKNSVKELLEIIDKKDKCAGVWSTFYMACSYMPPYESFSTTGNEAMYMIKSYIYGKYPMNVYSIKERDEKEYSEWGSWWTNTFDNQYENKTHEEKVLFLYDIYNNISEENLKKQFVISEVETCLKNINWIKLKQISNQNAEKVIEWVKNLCINERISLSSSIITAVMGLDNMLEKEYYNMMKQIFLNNASNTLYAMENLEEIGFNIYECTNIIKKYIEDDIEFKDCIEIACENFSLYSNRIRIRNMILGESKKVTIKK